MKRNYFFVLIGIAICCAFLILIFMLQETKSPKIEQQSFPRPQSPYKTYISGVGIAEPSSENISIGAPPNRIVSKIPVIVGMKVNKGDVLLRLDNRDLLSDLINKQLLYKIAIAKLKKLESLPRQEDLISAQAKLKNAETLLTQAKTQYEMIQGLENIRVLSKDEMNNRYFKFQQAQAQYQEAEANLNKLTVGAWKPDLELAKLDVMQAKTAVEATKTEIERTIIRSPIDGTVLQIRIHDGESIPPDTLRTPIMIIGNIDEMFLKVSINQFDAPYFHSGAPAVAFLQGDAFIEFPLKFIRIEPYLINKQNLTNDIMEKVDTRVLHVIYQIANKDQRIFVGQQMDVFIEADYSQ